MTDIDTTIPADAPLYATNAEEYIERIRRGERAELVERLSTCQAQVRTAMSLLAQNATRLEHFDLGALEGLASADYNLGVLTERAQEGEIADVGDSDDDLRMRFTIMQSEEGDAQ